MTQTIRTIGFFAAAAFLAASAVHAVPPLISYQGELNDDAGIPVNGTISFIFRIYDVPSGGTALWTENQTISVSNGVFNAALGLVEPLQSSLFAEPVLYLGIRVGADQEMAPRQQIISAAYSQNAEILMPIGSIIAFNKSMPGTPGLSDAWVECNGQILADPDSPYDGQTIPDLNGAAGEQRFLRGATSSGGAGGENLHTLTVTELPSHTHGIEVDDPATVGIGRVGGGTYYNRTLETNPTGGNQPHENRPPYFEVVWIMRVK